MGSEALVRPSSVCRSARRVPERAGAQEGSSPMEMRQRVLARDVDHCRETLVYGKEKS